MQLYENAATILPLRPIFEYAVIIFFSLYENETKKPTSSAMSQARMGDLKAQNSKYIRKFRLENPDSAKIAIHKSSNVRKMSLYTWYT